MSEKTYPFNISTAASSDRRAMKTRESLFAAFARLMQDSAYDDIRVADIAAQANIVRSTFYEHFRSKDALLLESIEGHFHVLAASAVGECTPHQLRSALTHFWNRRALIRGLLTSVLVDRLTRRLSSMIYTELASRFDNHAPAHFLKARAVHSAGSQVALIRAWLAGDIPNDIEPIIELMLRSQVDRR